MNDKDLLKYQHHLEQRSAQLRDLGDTVEVPSADHWMLVNMAYLGIGLLFIKFAPDSEQQDQHAEHIERVIADLGKMFLHGDPEELRNDRVMAFCGLATQVITDRYADVLGPEKRQV